MTTMVILGSIILLEFQERILPESTTANDSTTWVSRSCRSTSSLHYDDLALDRHRIGVKKRPVDDLQLDKKRMKMGAMSEAPSSQPESLVLCCTSSLKLDAQDAPT